MVELGIAEIVGVMAVFALVARLRVRDSLSNCANAVMARYAGFGDTRMVEPRNGPLSCRVAAFALRLRDHVVAWLACRDDVIVATCASFWCASEYTALVTGIARDLCMRTGQRKTG